MTDEQIIINKMDKPKRYCEGIDCAWCNEKEPCIYKIANELEEKILRKEQECERLKEEVSLLKESNSKLQQIEDVNILEKCYLQQLDQLKAENEKLDKEVKLLRQYKCSKQASYESMQVERNKAVSRNQDLLKQVEKWQEKCNKLEAENEKLKHDNGYEVGALEKTIDNLKAENEDLKKQVNDLLNKPEIQDNILWKIDNETVI